MTYELRSPRVKNKEDTLRSNSLTNSQEVGQFEPRHKKNLASWFLTRSCTNRSVQPQIMASDL